MRVLLCVRRAVICAAVLSFIPAISADSKRNEAEALLDKAEQLSLLTQKGSPPFTLEATVEHGEGKQKKTANFYLLWQDAEHWRAMAVEGEHREIHVRNPEGMWLPKIPDPELTNVFSLGSAFPFMRGLISSDTEQVAGARERKLKSTLLSCALLRGANSEEEACFNPSSSMLERIDDRQRFAHDASHFVGDDIRAKNSVVLVEAVVEYLDYEKIGQKWLPHEIRWSVRGHVLSQLHLVKFVANPQTTSDLFSDPAEYEAWPYCERYSYAHPLRGVQLPESERINGVDVAKPADALFVVVGPEGKVREVRLLQPTGHDAKQWVDLLMKQRYQPATCDGKPVLGNIFIRLDSSR